MPSLTHEAMIEMIRQRPAVIAELLAGPLKIDVPTFTEARLLSSDLTAVTPTEYRADGVVALFDADRSGNPALAVVFEAQRRCDSRKRFSWPVYVATAHARHECPTALFVWCENRAVAEWAAEPISTGHPGLMLTPVVMGPDQVPIVVDPTVATRWPELSILSARAYGASAEFGEAVLRAFAFALTRFDLEHARLYIHYVAADLPLEARRRLEKVMTTAEIPFSEFASFVFPETFAKGKAEGKAEGRAEGKAESLFAILSARSIAVPDDVRERIATCTDVEQLEAWTVRAATAQRIGDLFA